MEFHRDITPNHTTFGPVLGWRTGEGEGDGARGCRPHLQERRRRARRSRTRSSRAARRRRNVSGRPPPSVSDCSARRRSARQPSVRRVLQPKRRPHRRAEKAGMNPDAAARRFVGVEAGKIDLKNFTTGVVGLGPRRCRRYRCRRYRCRCCRRPPPRAAAPSQGTAATMQGRRPSSRVSRRRLRSGSSSTRAA